MPSVEAADGAMPAITAKKSYKDGHVAIGIRLHCSGYGPASARINASAQLTIAEARALAQSLVEFADKADEKAAAKAAADQRRRKWRDREVAAGRMVIMDAGEFFHGRR